MGRILVHVTLRQTYIQWGVFGEEFGGIGQELFPCLCRGEVVHLLSVPGRNLRIPGVKDKVLLEGHRTEVVGVSKGLLLIPVGVFLLQGKCILFTFLNNLLVFCTMRLCAFFAIFWSYLPLNWPLHLLLPPLLRLLQHQLPCLPPPHPHQHPGTPSQSTGKAL